MSRWRPKSLLCLLLLFSSGLCALVYQVSWIRWFRAVFGVSTQASAVVMAIFLGGLGLGALYFGRRIDRSRAPLRFYGLLELGVTLASLATIALLPLARLAYTSLGGVAVMGLPLATAVRLGLAMLVIGPAVFLMGGTLPALTRALTAARDRSRRPLGLLYCVNALGAFVGSLLAAFWLHEALGIRLTLLWACAFNVLVGLVAIVVGLDEDLSDAPSEPMESEPAESTEIAAPRPWILTAVWCTGFVFLLMELVWYRMLAPLLGGSTYTISLILSGALLGIGLGGQLYASIWINRRPTLGDFALSAGLQAVLLVLPFALGDHFAVWVTTLASGSFAQLVGAWSLVIMIVVLPASLIAGLQFPLLIALLGTGRDQVGRDIGSATVLNSLGSICGSLAAGFGLMSLLSAPGTWRFAVLVCVGLSLGSLVRARRSRVLAGSVLTLLALSLVLTAQHGPSGPWRHSGIGVGRAGLRDASQRNEVRDWINVNRRQIIWERDGLESTVGISDLDGYAFIVNGKTDGNAVGDASTQVMSGLIGAALHPDPRKALVVGLGTGSTAGWLGKVPSLQRVDVVELEPAVLEMAKRCAPVNEGVLDNPKVTVRLGDAREYLLTTSERYDLILSEPSNPYRAGISSMYTHEYYRDVAARLQPKGLFLQWLQGYSVDRETVARVYSTLHAVFPYVETWITGNKDLILVGSGEPLVHDEQRLAKVVASEPFARAMHAAWRVEGLPGFLSRYYGSEAFTRSMLQFQGDQLNRDDQPYIEFAMARSVNRESFDPFREWETMDPQWRRPPLRHTFAVDWALVDENRVNLLEEGLPMHRNWFRQTGDSAASWRRMEALTIYFRLKRTDPDYQENLRHAFELWGGFGETPRMRDAWLLLGEWAAISGNREEVERAVAHLSLISPAEGEILRAMAATNYSPRAAADHLLAAFTLHQKDPWPRRSLLDAALMLTPWVAANDRSACLELYASLRTPFSVESLRYKRMVVLSLLAGSQELGNDCLHAYGPQEPFVPWDLTFLEGRARCYERCDSPLAERAAADLALFRRWAESGR